MAILLMAQLMMQQNSCNPRFGPKAKVVRRLDALSVGSGRRPDENSTVLKEKKHATATQGRPPYERTHMPRNAAWNSFRKHQ